jgi:hypothetical protein
VFLVIDGLREPRPGACISEEAERVGGEGTAIWRPVLEFIE